MRRLVAGYDHALGASLLLLLLTPGAAESLARCANDAPVFLWSTVVMAAIARRGRTTTLAGLLALGPLVKLTALPVAAVVVVWLWRERGRAAAAAGVVSASLVVLVQAVRGWAWGGTVELNLVNTPGQESWLETVVGLARSIYTFAKTTIWLGGWSFFRPPPWWLGALVALAAWYILSVRFRRNASVPLHNLAGLLVAAAGILVFAFGQRRLFGEWGGLGGWYAWGWFPWLFTAALSTSELRKGFGRATLIAVAVFVTVTNWLWFSVAGGIYGWP